MSARGRRHDLDDDIAALGNLHEILQLLIQHLFLADRIAQRGFADEGGQLRRARLSQHSLPVDPVDHPPIQLLRIVDHADFAEEGPRVRNRLQQSGHKQRLPGSDRRRPRLEQAQHRDARAHRLVARCHKPGWRAFFASAMRSPRSGPVTP
jgi:hypothetical protein